MHQIPTLGSLFILHSVIFPPQEERVHVALCAAAPLRGTWSANCRSFLCRLCIGERLLSLSFVACCLFLTSTFVNRMQLTWPTSSLVCTAFAALCMPGKFHPASLTNAKSLDRREPLTSFNAPESSTAFALTSRSDDKD